ncbi:uncharacterized protein LOC109860479 [Pseudomyrmex gracilis]|uniref:uncharacterized protein LOC109860479 n=1 Tax=Pseudomyrmex gracilis TaxID=219809 RepID=UPI000995DC76|nr:uncharacterized protein LOC109860479 [Pseudomyrmex gracilis]
MLVVAASSEQKTQRDCSFVFVTSSRDRSTLTARNATFLRSLGYAVDNGDNNNNDVLSVGGEPVLDDRIVKIETHTYNPYGNTSFGHSDEIRIPIQQQDVYTLPYNSYLYVKRKFSLQTTAGAAERSGAAAAALTNNCVAFMFDEIRYELNSVEIDRNRNPGVTSTLKNYVFLTTETGNVLRHAGWNLSTNKGVGEFNFCVPLRTLLGFCEDYKRVVINARHELILIRSRNDNNSIFASANSESTVELHKVQWRIPHVVLNDVNKLKLLRTLESGRYLSMGFCSWDLYEYPLLQSTTSHSWAVKAAKQLEKPRYIIFALQTGRKNVVSRDCSRFDYCNLSNVKLFLNSEFYPYDDLNLDFSKERYAVLYNMYVKFNRAYYGRDEDEALLTLDKFIYCGPLVVIDWLR